jgi:phosphogluconate dehydratase
VIRELLDAGYHARRRHHRQPGGLHDYGRVPERGGEGVVWKDLPAQSGDDSVVRRAAPFSATGGLKLLTATSAAR